MTSWFRVSSFLEKQRDFVSANIKKGMTVYVDGDVSVSKYTTDDGRTHFMTNVTASIFSLDFFFFFFREKLTLDRNHSDFKISQNSISERGRY
jgi:single-stranded DNA-binding protein